MEITAVENIIDYTKQGDVENQNNKNITIKILDIPYTIKIGKVLAIIENANIMRYSHASQSGWVSNKGSTVLAFDTRSIIEKEDEIIGNIVIVESLRNGDIVPLGFIVRHIKDFFTIFS